MSQIPPIGDYMLDPPEDPPECGECGTPHEGDTCPACGHPVPEEDPDLHPERLGWQDEIREEQR